MSYFSKFPLRWYELHDRDQVQLLVTDIIHRFALRNSVTQESQFYYYYDLEDGERPEDVAYKVYGDTTYHWIVLLLNKIIDPYFGWCLSTNELENVIQSKYPGKAFVLEHNITQFTVSADSTFYLNENINTASGATATVVYHDISSLAPNCNLVHVSNISGTFQVGDVLTSQDIITKTADVLAITAQGNFVANNEPLLQTYFAQTTTNARGKTLEWDAQNEIVIVKMEKSTFNASNQAPIYEYDADNVITGKSALIRSSVDYTDAPHHYVNRFGDIVPRLYGAYVPGRDGDTSQGNFLVSGALVSVDLNFQTAEVRTTVTDNLGSAVIGPITNREYEETTNEAKRHIKLLKPEYVKQVTEELENRMKLIGQR